MMRMVKCRMRFRVSKLLHAVVGASLTESFDADSVWLDDETRLDNAAAALTFTRMKDSIMVEGRIEGAVKVQCVRSLELFDFPISTELEDVFFALPHHRLTENPLEDDELHHVTDDGFIDLTEPVREHVLMAIPIDPISPAFRDDQKAQANMEKLLGEDSADWLRINWSDKNRGPD